MGVLATTLPSDLVQSQRVRAAVYTDPAIFNLEMDRLFGRAWLFVAHESQLRNPGDFITTRLGRVPVVATRGTDRTIHIVENRCGHRGAVLCPARSGTLAHAIFQCSYHDWTFHCDGRVRSVPARDGYDFERRRDDFALRRVPRVDLYRGFIFASLATDGPDLRTFLGFLTTALDDLIDRAPDGEIEFAGGCYRHTTPSNWKLQIENLNDLSHASATHRSSVAVVDTVTKPMPAPPIGVHRAAGLRVNGAPLSTMDQLGVRAFARGHSFIGGLPRPPRSGPVMDEYRRRLEKRHSKSEVDRILSVDRHLNIIYPTLLTQGMIGIVKVLTPLAPDRTETTVWPVRFKGAPDELFHYTIRGIANSNSVANFTLPDDLAMYRRCQEAVAANPGAWIDFSRSAGEEVPDNDGGFRGRGLNEMSIRNAYRAWLDYMEHAA